MHFKCTLLEFFLRRIFTSNRQDFTTLFLDCPINVHGSSSLFFPLICHKSAEGVNLKQGMAGYILCYVCIYKDSTTRLWRHCSIFALDETVTWLTVASLLWYFIIAVMSTRSFGGYILLDVRVNSYGVVAYICTQCDSLDYIILRLCDLLEYLGVSLRSVVHLPNTDCINFFLPKRAGMYSGST